MNNIEYGNKEFKRLNVVGEKVLLEKLIKDNFMMKDGIYMPTLSSENKNERLGIGKILEITNETAEKYGLAVGDYVFYDYFSANGDWKENIITNCDNIILKLTENEAKDFLNGSLKV